MKIARKIAIILWISAALAVQANAQRMPHNSYLNKPAHSVAQLINQVRNDPVVAKRFMLHYGMDKEQIIAFFRTLRVGKLQKTGYYKIFNIDKNYRISSKMLRVV